MDYHRKRKRPKKRESSSSSSTPKKKANHSQSPTPKKNPEPKKTKPNSLLTEEYLFETTENLHIYKTFAEMNLKESILKGLIAYGFDKPSAVQQRAIVPIMKGRDVIVQAQAGTGKTCVFAVGALQ